MKVDDDINAHGVAVVVQVVYEYVSVLGVSSMMGQVSG